MEGRQRGRPPRRPPTSSSDSSSLQPTNSLSTTASCSVHDKTAALDAIAATALEDSSCSTNAAAATEAPSLPDEESTESNADLFPEDPYDLPPSHPHHPNHALHPIRSPQPPTFFWCGPSWLRVKYLPKIGMPLKKGKDCQKMF